MNTFKKLEKSIKEYDKIQSLIKEKIYSLVEDVNNHFSNNDLEFYIEFPNYYLGYELSFVVNGDCIKCVFEYVDPYEELFDSNVHLEIPIDLLQKSEEEVLEYFLELNYNAVIEDLKEHVNASKSSLESFAISLDDAKISLNESKELLLKDLKSLEREVQDLIIKVTVKE